MTEVGSRPRRLLVGRIPAPLDGVEVDLATVATRIADFGLQELDADGSTVPAGQVLEQLSVGTAPPHTLVAMLNPLAVDQLRQRFGAGLVIEEDAPLDPQEPPGDRTGFFALSNTLPLSDVLSVEIEVVSDEGVALERASVTVEGSGWIDRAVTDAQGRATVEMFGETPGSLRRILIKPAGGFWGREILNPVISDGVNRITLASLSVGAGLGQNAGWGTAAMNLVSAGDPTETVRVAVIDSGLATSHEDLAPEGGFDFGGGPAPNTSWGNDGSGHGTHVSGTVAALNNAFGVRGLAPGVELFGFRVFPEATMSKLIAAVDRCIENQIDVANMSLGSTSASILLQQRLLAAREAGVLFVAAAGNSGGPVLFPGGFPEVLCVAAIGRLGTFPDDSPHARHVTDMVSDDGQYFAAGFTCRGPEVDVCAPGVAVISSVPPNDYAAFDGTSMASPHVAGFAARLLQLSPGIRAMARGAGRSQALFDAVLGRCQPLGLSPEFQGAGLPVLPVATDEGVPGDDPDGDSEGITDSASGLTEIRDLIEQALRKARELA